MAQRGKRARRLREERLPSLRRVDVGEAHDVALLGRILHDERIAIHDADHRPAKRLGVSALEGEERKGGKPAHGRSLVSL